jgi:hypothetical protein
LVKGTWPYADWGENARAQHGTGELVHPTKPGDLLPVGKLELFDGIHLPDGVRFLGNLPNAVWFAARESGRLPVPQKATLQSTSAGQVR